MCSGLDHDPSQLLLHVSCEVAVGYPSGDAFCSRDKLPRCLQILVTAGDLSLVEQEIALLRTLRHTVEELRGAPTPTIADHLATLAPVVLGQQQCETASAAQFTHVVVDFHCVATNGDALVNRTQPPMGLCEDFEEPAIKPFMCPPGPKNIAYLHQLARGDEGRYPVDERGRSHSQCTPTVGPVRDEGRGHRLLKNRHGQ